jgi:hypothetical protein
MKHDIQDMTDAERITQVANHLDTSEFEVFRRAHLDWHGRDAGTRMLERIFARYLHCGDAPPWVRHYTRTYLRSHPGSIPATSRNAVAGAALSRLVDNRLVRYLLS